MKKWLYPVYMLIVSGAAVGFAILERQLRLLASTTPQNWPNWLMIASYLLMGAFFIIAVGIRKKSSLSRDKVVLVNIAAIAVTVSLYTLFGAVRQPEPSSYLQQLTLAGFIMLCF